MILEGHRANLKTLLQAAGRSDLALVECRDKASGKPIIVVAAYRLDGTEYVVTPLAKMFDGNPYDEIVPPWR